MKRIKILCATATLCLGLLASPSRLPAEEYCTDVGGCGYQQCRSCPVLAPAVALAVATLAAIIAVALQTNNSPHSHSH